MLVDGALEHVPDESRSVYRLAGDALLELEHPRVEPVQQGTREADVNELASLDDRGAAWTLSRLRLSDTHNYPQQRPARSFLAEARASQERTPMATISRRGRGQPSALCPSEPPPTEGIELSTEGNHEQRMRDTDLARILEYPRPRKIRELIGRYEKEGKIGEVLSRPTVGRGINRGKSEGSQVVNEYWLTREQACFIAAKSETARATLYLKWIIDVFLGAQRGELPVQTAPSALPPKAREAPDAEPPELAAAVELLGGVDPRVRAALRRLPAPKRPSVAHYVDQARELAQLVERTEPPLPADTHACARLASSLILATNAAPDHPLVLGVREDLARTIATIDRLLARAALDPDLRDRVADLRSRWTAEVERLAR